MDKIRTAADVEALPVTGERYRAWDAVTKGLCVRVGASGSKTWQFEYRDLAGKRQCVRLGPCERLKPGDARKLAKTLGPDPAAAKREAKAAAALAKREKAARKASVLRTFLTEGTYAAELAAKRSGLATRKRIEHEFVSLLDRPMSEITALDLERLRRKRLKAGIAPQTLNRSWNALRAALNAAVRLGVLQVNPVPRERLKRLPAPDDRRVRWLGQRDPFETHEKGERARFLEALETVEPHARTVVRISYWSGLRRGEVFSLTWGAVDLRQCVLTVLAHTAKTHRARRIPLPSPLVTALTEWRPEDAKPVDLVVPSPKTGERLTDIKRSWTSLVTRAQLVDFHFHDLRHDYASRLVQAGTPLTVVRDLLGHSTVGLTERYGHVAADQLRNAVEALA